MTKRFVLIDEDTAAMETGPLYSPAAAAPASTALSLLGPYLDAYGKAATWKKKTGNDGNDDTFTSSSITVLWAHGAKEVRTVQGTTLACQAICKCEAAVEGGDILTVDGRDWPVLGLVGASYDGSMRAVAMGGARSV